MIVALLSDRNADVIFRPKSAKTIFTIQVKPEGVGYMVVDHQLGTKINSIIVPSKVFNLQNQLRNSASSASMLRGNPLVSLLTN